MPKVIAYLHNIDIQSPMNKHFKLKVLIVKYIQLLYFIYTNSGEYLSIFLLSPQLWGQ